MSKIIAFIPARGGSKGIPNKNIKTFCGKPLISHSIQYALNSDLIDKVIVSSDDQKILEIANNEGAMIIERPSELATDTSTTESAIHHYLNNSKENPKIIVLLQATSPIRPKESLDAALNYFMKKKFDSLLSICPTHRFFWKINDKKNTCPEYNHMHRPRRQDIKPNQQQYVENGSIYIFTKKQFKKTNNRLGGKIGHVIWPEEYHMEIDTPLDFSIAEKAYEFLNLG
jgi:N-acylneuraminate cytidylyltransferase